MVGAGRRAAARGGMIRAWPGRTSTVPAARLAPCPLPSTQTITTASGARLRAASPVVAASREVAGVGDEQPVRSPGGAARWRNQRARQHPQCAGRGSRRGQQRADHATVVARRRESSNRPGQPDRFRHMPDGVPRRRSARTQCVDASRSRRPADHADAAVAAWREPVIDRQLPARAAGPLPRLPGPPRLPGLVRAGLPAAVPRADRREKAPRAWDAIHLENEWLRLMILPELGGRIHVGYDKTTGYDFFYRNNVIKPALVGLAGPWISGGVEFNWPQHHRPGDVPAGRRATIEQRGRRRGHGLVLRPRSVHAHEGHARHPPAARTARVIELRVRLYNRTDETADLPVVGERRRPRRTTHYQSFFPHRRALRRRPRQARHRPTFPAADRPLLRRRLPGPRATPSGPTRDRLDWYRNIPVPTSYMCLGTDDDFFGGYDHAARRRVRARGRPPDRARQEAVDVGQRRLRLRLGPQPHRRRRALRRADGRGLHRQPAGLLLPRPRRDEDVQPVLVPDPGDRPGRTRPPRRRGAPRRRPGTAAHGSASRSRRRAPRRVGSAAAPRRRGLVHERGATWRPGRPSCRPPARAPSRRRRAARPSSTAARTLDRLAAPRSARPRPELPAPRDRAAGARGRRRRSTSSTSSALHLEQYRHATRSPEPYWEEALRRDPGDTRCATSALAARRSRRAGTPRPSALLRRAVAR